MKAAWLLLCIALCGGFPPAIARAGGSLSMPLGVDDAGAPAPIYDDPLAQAAFDAIGFDFLVYHIHGEPSVADLGALVTLAESKGFDFLVYHIHGEPSVADLGALVTLAESKGFDFILNQENTPPTPGDPSVYNRPGLFFQPPVDFMTVAGASLRFRGLIYDEAEHWLTNGVYVTTGGGPFIPCFHDAEGETLDQAYAGNLANLTTLMARHCAGFAANAQAAPQGNVSGPVTAVEYVFPILS
ncbi:MAG: hypothetical protein M1457_13170, partial [bacterium]|nr:hypothetical protein [bacterium]